MTIPNIHVIVVATSFILIFSTQSRPAFGDDILPPVRTEVKFAESGELKNDDPDKAWAEWGETDETRKNPFPRRQREIKEGMDIHTIMGMAMRQPKVVTAVLSAEFGATETIGQMVIAKFKNQMAAAGIGCALYFVLHGRQVVAKCETIRDGHMAKEYLIMQPEIIRTVIDNIAFTPKPRSANDDSDDDNDSEDGAAPVVDAHVLDDQNPTAASHSQSIGEKSEL